MPPFQVWRSPLLDYAVKRIDLLNRNNHKQREFYGNAAVVVWKKSPKFMAAVVLRIRSLQKKEKSPNNFLN